MRPRIATLLVIAVAIALAGCNSEKSVTGSYGERQLTGKVVPVGDLLGTSPAGIEVRAHGVVAVTDSSGAFLLNGVPSGNLDLLFLGSAQGVNATLTVGPDDQNVTVELQRSSASTRKRGARSSRIQIEGLVTAISPTSISVQDASRHMEVTCAIVDTTKIRKGNRLLTTADILVGDRVHVSATPNPDGTWTAGEIKLQEGEDTGGDPFKRELEGPVVAISADSITVTDASTGEQTAKITADTVIRKGNVVLTPADIKVGDRVHVRAKIETDKSLTAQEIMLQNSL